MTKSIQTLKSDIENVLSTGEGWTEDIADWVGEQISKGLTRQLTPKLNSVGTLRMSSLGQPCERKLWYSVQPSLSSLKEVLQPNTLNKFIFGDMIEAYTLGLIKASGHSLEGMQDQVQILGIKGSRDCVIDGMVFDIKSASTMSMNKFKNNGLRENDPFGYLSQLSSYVYASKDDPLVTNKTHGGFVAIDKQFGHIEIDIYDLTTELSNKEAEVQRKKDVVKSPETPKRSFEDVPDGKSGNRKLGTNCSYCEFKQICWPDLQTYIYSTGPRYLTEVVREPKVFRDD